MSDPAILYTPKTTIELSSILGRKFFRKHQFQLDTGSVWEVFRALKAAVPGFAEEILRLQRLGMEFAVFRNGQNVGVENFELGGTKTLRILPVIKGGKRAGLLQTVIGAVLIVAGYGLSGFTGGASTALVPVGAALAAGGVIQMLSPQASGLRQSASPENMPSYAFGSAKNTVASGNPVPICVGNRRWGGAIISASIVAEDKA
ncbi:MULTISPECIES: tail assembly protein [unclassified Pseudomonas]|uniref:tail assembly protein n=1 Tax=unclassified Pseudomonas TaxID=196821 RepID=UPI000D396BA8|nr:MULTISPECIES: tail assembly protein [unclassified Pseudomonas]RAU43420.1 tail assembly protein [Pseudomonas sp. RIT 409]RAU50043.1 tail assembly protein [Pseudomonas sp. RIT 412]